jgi:hypothetical protein
LLVLQNGSCGLLLLFPAPARARRRSFVNSIFANPEFVWIETISQQHLASYPDGASRGLGFEIGEELIEHGVALGINADEYR